MRSRQAASEIIQYVLHHPEAKDTIDGIRNFWLLQSEQWTQPELEDAVALLVSMEWMRGWETEPGVRLYAMGMFSVSELQGRLSELVEAPHEMPLDTPERRP